MSKSFLRSTRRLLLVVFALCASGCGAEAYQARVDQNTVPFFRLQRELEENLGPRVAKGEISLRLPAPFAEMPAPKKPKPGEPERRDPRLPPGLNATNLVGLLGGFKGTMQAVVDPSANGKNAEATVYAYILSNRSLLNAKEPSVKPQEFDKMLINAVSAGLGRGTVSVTSLKPVEVGGGQFQPDLRYDALMLDTMMNGVPMQYEVYIRRERPLQVAVVFVVPQEAAREERLRERIDLALQSVRLETPAAGATAGAAAGAPSSGGPGF